MTKWFIDDDNFLRHPDTNWKIDMLRVKTKEHVFRYLHDAEEKPWCTPEDLGYLAMALLNKVNP